MKIALLLPYFGKLPPYFNYFLRSLRNVNIDVLFISDLEVPEFPNNFKCIQMHFDEFKVLSSKKLGVEVRLDSPRRLCDFKPMYGKIFEDYLVGYNYWAFGDCDLCFGKKFNDDLAYAISSGCDVFSVESCFMAGPFSMIRNCPECNLLFKNASNWIDVVRQSGTRCMAFDELCGDWHSQLRSRRMSIEDCRQRADSFSAVVLRSDHLKHLMIDVVTQEDLTLGGFVRMRADGCLFYHEKEISLYHYIRSKMHKYFTYVCRPYAEINEFSITKSGFYNEGIESRLRYCIHLRRMLFAGIRSLCEKAEIGFRKVSRRCAQTSN